MGRGSCSNKALVARRVLKDRLGTGLVSLEGGGRVGHSSITGPNLSTSACSFLHPADEVLLKPSSPKDESRSPASSWSTSPLRLKRRLASWSRACRAFMRSTKASHGSATLETYPGVDMDDGQSVGVSTRPTASRHVTHPSRPVPSRYATSPPSQGSDGPFSEATPVKSPSPGLIALLWASSPKTSGVSTSISKPFHSEKCFSGFPSLGKFFS